jgi:hypothetical protein
LKYFKDNLNNFSLEFKKIDFDNLDGYYACKEGFLFDIKQEKFIDGSIDKDGYLLVNLRHKDNSRARYKKHRVILQTFNPVPNYKELQVNHKNGNKADNNIINLEWCTAKENVEHSIITKLRDPELDRSVINESECRNFCRMLEQGYSPKMIAQYYYTNKEDIEKYARIIGDIKTKGNLSSISNINVPYKYGKFRSNSYTIFEIEKICELLENNNLSVKDISFLIFRDYNKKYRDDIKAIKNHKQFTQVSKYYKF